MSFFIQGFPALRLDDSLSKQDAFDLTYGTNPAGLDYHKAFVFKFTNPNEWFAWCFAPKDYSITSPLANGITLDPTVYDSHMPKPLFNIVSAVNKLTGNFGGARRSFNYNDTGGQAGFFYGSDPDGQSFPNCFWKGQIWIPAFAFADTATGQVTTYDDGSATAGTADFGGQNVPTYPRAGGTGAGSITITINSNL